MTRLNKIELALLILASKAGTMFAHANGGTGLAATYRHKKPRNKGKKGTKPNGNGASHITGRPLALPN